MAFLAAPGAPHMVAHRPTGVSVRRIQGGEKPVDSVRWNGPAHLVNNPTKAHDIFPRGYVGTRGTGKKAQRGAALLGAFGLDARSKKGGIRLADGEVRAHVHHPGTHGKHFFELGVLAGRPLAAAEMQKVVLAELGKSFR
jgi:hypothetical protein